MSWDYADDFRLECHSGPLPDGAKRELERLLHLHGLAYDGPGSFALPETAVSGRPPCQQTPTSRLRALGSFTLLAWTGNQAVGTATLAGEVIKMVAVDPAAQGQGVMAKLITEIVRRAGEYGQRHFFVFTPPRNRDLFTPLGFSWLAGYADKAGLLEFGTPDLRDFIDRIGRPQPGVRRGAIVVNCNPFTLGHRYLIETAARQVDELLVFVLAEDRSLFPTEVRQHLVTTGVRDLNNVRVFLSGPYIISAATFPAYFLRDAELAKVQAGLDATVFATCLAPNLGIVTRFVGEEPYCATTSQYNAAMTEVFAHHGLALVVVPRREFAPGRAISASTVREAIRSADESLLAQLLPATTREFLRSPAAAPLIEKIRTTRSAH